MTARRAAPAVALLVAIASVGAVARTRAPIDAPGPWATAPIHRVDLNTAPEAELGLLPRIGPTLAERIVEEREANGPFTDLEELAERVRGIGPRTVERVGGFVRIDACDLIH
ncbi:MAG: ComEA family DNA-binding protein [Phycisphaerales bacterium]